MTVGGRSGQQPATDAGRPGRRQAAILAGHRGDVAGARAALADPDPEVRTAGLGALARLAHLDLTVLAAALADPDPRVRRRACEAAGEAAAQPRTGSGPLAPETVVGPLVSALHDRAASVVETAAWALGELGHRAGMPAVDGLVVVAGSHLDPLCREAAIAALGAIGHDRGLNAVLGGLHDKPAIRRRAAVALAAFDDPAAEAGLRRCLADRDWQVRQVAEVLLDAPPR